MCLAATTPLPPLGAEVVLGLVLVGSFASSVCKHCLSPVSLLIPFVPSVLKLMSQVSLTSQVSKLTSQVSLPGPYQVTIKLLRSNYTSVDETNHHNKHPVMHFDNLLGVESWLRFKYAPPLTNRSVEQIIFGDGLPWCEHGRNAEARGRWVSRHGDGELVTEKDGLVWLSLANLFLDVPKGACPKSRNGALGCLLLPGQG
jgi:hypothetical protein